MKCVILAAGYGTRLWHEPELKDKAKTFLEIGGVPILRHILDRVVWVRGLDEIYVITNDKFWKDFIKWHSQCCDKNVLYRGKIVRMINNGTKNNETRLGGVRDFVYALNIRGIRDDILVIASDNFFDFDLEKLVNFSNERKATAVALYDVKNLEEAKRFGVVSIDKKRKITAFEEKPKNPKSSLVSTGCYVFRKEDLPAIFKYARTQPRENLEGPGFLIRDFYPEKPVYGCVFNGFWFDVGTPEQYRHVKKLFSWMKSR